MLYNHTVNIFPRMTNVHKVSTAHQKMTLTFLKYDTESFIANQTLFIKIIASSRCYDLCDYMNFI